MAARLAHELNQPLTALRLYATAAEELASTLNLPDLHDCLKRVDEQSLHAAEIIRRARSFGNRDASRREEVDVNRLIREVAAILDYDFRQARVRLELNLAATLPGVWADGVQIQQVLVNLLRNALDAMTHATVQRRVLAVRSALVERFVRVDVADTGVGIEPALVDSLFEPFRSSKPAGMGLGLAICRTLVEAHGGSIGVEASSPQGTTFFFLLPLASDEGAP